MDPLLNKVINRFLPITVSVAKGLEAEPKISDFEIIKQIGEGSFGRVYSARHKNTNMVYAIKEINKFNKNNQEGMPYFRREIDIMYKIHHPNVVRLFSHFEDDKNCYFVMEYVKHGNLFDQDSWQRFHCLNSSEVAKYMKDLISAVYYLHNMTPPIIHRDIKPENVLINQNGHAKLTDFGWSNYVNSEVRSTYCGTPVYLAPEMIKEIGHDENLDIWCIGILMFELLTGNVPFRGKDFQSLNKNILSLKIHWTKDINIDAKNLISKILKPDPKDRISLVNMLKHSFFTKHLGHCDLLIQCLVKPSLCEYNEPFILSKDLFQEDKEQEDTEIDSIHDEFNQKITQNESYDIKDSQNKGELVQKIQNEFEQLSIAYNDLLLVKNKLNKQLEEANQRETFMVKEKIRLINDIEGKNNENKAFKKEITDLKQSLIQKEEQLLLVNQGTNTPNQQTSNPQQTSLSEEDYEKLIKEKELEFQSKLTEIEYNTINNNEIDDQLFHFHQSIKQINETLSIPFASNNQSELDVYKEKMEAQLKVTKDYFEQEIENMRKEAKKEKEKLTLLLKLKEEEIKKLTLSFDSNLKSDKEKAEKIIEKYKAVLKAKEGEIEVLKLKNKKMEMMYNTYMKKEKEKDPKIAQGSNDSIINNK